MRNALVTNSHLHLAPRSPNSVGQAIRQMDSIYRTQFETWIRNPVNIEYVALRIRPLVRDYTIEQLANALVWIMEGWTLDKKAELIYFFTKSWTQCQQLMLCKALAATATAYAFTFGRQRSTEMGQHPILHISTRVAAASIPEPIVPYGPAFSIYEMYTHCLHTYQTMARQYQLARQPGKHATDATPPIPLHQNPCIAFTRSPMVSGSIAVSVASAYRLSGMSLESQAIQGNSNISNKT